MVSRIPRNRVVNVLVLEFLQWFPKITCHMDFFLYFLGHFVFVYSVEYLFISSIGSISISV